MTTLLEKNNEIVEKINKSFAEAEPLEEGEIYACAIALEDRYVRQGLVLDLIKAGYSTSLEAAVEYVQQEDEYPSQIHKLTVYKLGGTK